jgi:hypothetical protein
MEKYLMDDILIGIGSFLYEENLSFHHDREEWHTFFYEKKEHYSILGGLRFRRDGVFPEIDELDQAYQNMISTELMHWRGIDVHPPHEFTPGCRESFEEYSKKYFDEQEIKELEKLANEFKQKFSLESKV